MELILQHQIPTRGPSLCMFYLDTFLIVRQGTKLMKLETKTLSMVSELELGIGYDLYPAGINGDLYFEFQPNFTYQISLSTLQAKKINSLNLQKATFAQIPGQLLILQQNMLQCIELYDLQINTVAILPPEVQGNITFVSGKQIAITQNDDLYIYDTQLQTFNVQDIGYDTGYCLNLGPNKLLTFQEKFAFYINYSNQTKANMRRFRASVSNSRPAYSQELFALVDDSGCLQTFSLDLTVHIACMNQIKVQVQKKPVQLIVANQRDKYDMFAYLLKKYVTKFKEENEKRKSDKQMMNTCLEINELITTIRSKALKQIKNQDMKQYIQKEVQKAFQDQINNQMLLQDSIIMKQNEFRDLTDKICLTKRQIKQFDTTSEKPVEKTFNIDQLRKQEEEKIKDEFYNQKLERLKKLKEEMEQIKKNKDRISEIKAAEEKRKLELEKKKLEEQKLKEEAEREKARKDAEAQRKKLEEEQKLKELEDKRRYEENLRLRLAEQERKQKELLQKQEEERLQEEENKRKAEQRMKEIEEEAKKSSKSQKFYNHQYQLFCQGPSVTFIMSDKHVLIRQGCYLLKVNFKNYKIENFIALSTYANQVCGYYAGYFIELSQQSFRINCENFEKQEIDIKVEQGLFAQQRNQLYVVGQTSVQVIDLVKIQASELAGQYDNVHCLNKPIFVKGAQAFEVNDGKFAKTTFKEEYKRPYISLTGSGKMVSFSDNKVYSDTEVVMRSKNIIETAIGCVVGGACLFSDSQGILVSLMLE
ncbi:Conserved_hypothetical protein [Hexamita inflata]|uniref:Uncharacterized protein n=1 Tax=Hexamita inflata TaxID=28002 RepID=A0ABP1GJ39_9EUKA